MKGACRTQDCGPLWLALFIGRPPRNLYRGLGCLGARITKEHLIQSRYFRQHTGNRFLAGDPVKIGCVP